MTLVCIERPNRTRPRPFKPNDVGRIYCRVLLLGSTRKEIILAVNKKCPGARICDCDAIIKLLVAIGILLSQIIDTVLTPLSIIVGLLRAAIGRFRFLQRIPILNRLFRVLDRTLALKLQADATLILLNDAVAQLGAPVPI